MCLGGPRLQRYVTQGGHASECYGALRGGGGQNRKFLRYVLLERPLKIAGKLGLLKITQKVCISFLQYFP